jgi:N-acyl-D-amino-acid deacylase
MRRRTFLQIGLLALAAPRSRAAELVSVAQAFDSEIEKFMKARGIPGGALAVVKDRRLVYAKGYGWADREKQLFAAPNSLFRIASISKPVTAVAILKLVEENRLRLDAPVFALLGLKGDDPRLTKITINHLLHHTSGWDRDKSFDPMFRAREIAASLGTTPPARPADIIRHMLGQPLDFDPGTRHAYSNFGYCVLGRVIEKITGQPYEQHVREKVLAPLGITRMRIGASLSGGQVPGEVRYYTAGNATTASVFDEPPPRVPWPYGGFHLEAMDAHGGWIASAIDLARFAAALDDPAHSPLLRPETFPTLYAPPEPPVARNPDGSLAASYYACGWSVRPVGETGKANYWHNGSLPGTTTLLVRRWDGLSWPRFSINAPKTNNSPTAQSTPRCTAPPIAFRPGPTAIR